MYYMATALQSSNRRQRLLDAAGSLFSRWGFDKTSMDDIARETGISKGAVYLEFPNNSVGDSRRSLYWKPVGERNRPCFQHGIGTLTSGADRPDLCNRGLSRFSRLGPVIRCR